MSDDDVLEKSSQDESSSVDIVELLEAANSKVFDDQDGLTDRNKNFEKVTSFFDLIKSSNNEDANLAEQIQIPESSAEGSLDEEIVGLKVASSDGATDDNEIDEENFEPLDVIEQSRETVEKLKSQDKAETDQVEETSEEYLSLIHI